METRRVSEGGVSCRFALADAADASGYHCYGLANIQVETETSVKNDLRKQPAKTTCENDLRK